MNKKLSLIELKEANRPYFEPSKVKMFGDKQYYVMYGGDNKPYMVRLTQAWTDMFGKQPYDHYRINEIELPSLRIGSLIEEEFKTMGKVKKWLSELQPIERVDE